MLRKTVNPFPERPRRAELLVPLLLIGAVLWGTSCESADTLPLRGILPHEWPSYGRDPGGGRFSPLEEITRQNVSSLEIAWIYHTGEAGPAFETSEETSLEVTPLVVDGVMYVSTPLGRVIALDPASGKERWVFDPKVDRTLGFGDFTNRGVSFWKDPEAGPDVSCRQRVFVGVIDARLIALDAVTGQPCLDFGDAGTVDLHQGLRVPPFEFEAYEVTSPPAIIGNLVITGSAIADNSRIAPASGEVRAFDARTGVLRWSWDPIPQHPQDPAFASWKGAEARQGGAGNAWSVITVDPERDLVFVPTSSPAPDYYGGLRKGSNRYANSIVALRASSGQVVWDFQTVHHDLWDYDNASPPALVVARRGDEDIPAVIQATKTGQLFVLHRESGEPLFSVEELPVPAIDTPGRKPGRLSPSRPASRY